MDLFQRVLCLPLGNSFILCGSAVLKRWKNWKNILKEGRVHHNHTSPRLGPEDRTFVHIHKPVVVTYWALDAGRWALGAGCWVLGTWCWHWALGTGHWALGAGH